jgi:hypothetical protein
MFFRFFWLALAIDAMRGDDRALRQRLFEQRALSSVCVPLSAQKSGWIK